MKIPGWIYKRLFPNIICVIRMEFKGNEASTYVATKVKRNKQGFKVLEKFEGEDIDEISSFAGKTPVILSPYGSGIITIDLNEVEADFEVPGLSLKDLVVQEILLGTGRRYLMKKSSLEALITKLEQAGMVVVDIVLGDLAEDKLNNMHNFLAEEEQGHLSSGIQLPAIAPALPLLLGKEFVSTQIESVHHGRVDLFNDKLRKKIMMLAAILAFALSSAQFGIGLQLNASTSDLQAQLEELQINASLTDRLKGEYDRKTLLLHDFTRDGGQFHASIIDRLGALCSPLVALDLIDFQSGPSSKVIYISGRSKNANNIEHFRSRLESSAGFKTVELMQLKNNRKTNLREFELKAIL